MPRSQGQATAPTGPREPRSRQPGLAPYALALCLAALAILCRALLQALAPGPAYLVILLPAVVVAGVFLGTLPGAVVAAAGCIAVLIERPPFPGHGFSPARVDLLAFTAVCAAVLLATRTLRRSTDHAAMAEARLAEVFRQIPGAAAILKAPDGQLLLRSSQSDTILAQPAREVGRSDDLGSYGGVHPDGTPFAADDYPIVRALKTGEVVRGEQMRYRRPDGRLAYLEVHAGPVRAPEGHILAAVGMAFDISERVDAEERLRESEARHRKTAERLAAAIDAGTLGLWEFDLVTERVLLDATLAAMLGLPAAEAELDRAALGRLVHPADHARAGEVFAGAIATGETYADELRMLTAQDEERWVVTRGAVLPDAQKIVGVVRDVTHRRQREEALLAALQARDILMREADHRIKNSLQLVSSLLRLQLSRVDDADARHALEAALSRVTAVGDAHLALQRSPDLKSLDIDRMLDDLCGRVGLLNPAVTVRCSAQAGVLLDAELAIPLGLIASELLTNALRHAFPSGRSGEVTLSAVAGGGALDVVIADDGVGLPATNAGSGLGTTVVAALARQIGATVTRTSQPGSGTTIALRITLPAPCAQ